MSNFPNFLHRINNLRRAYKNAQNIEFKKVWFNMLVQLLEDEQPAVDKNFKQKILSTL